MCTREASCSTSCFAERCSISWSTPTARFPLSSSISAPPHSCTTPCSFACSLLFISSPHSLGYSGSLRGGGARCFARPGLCTKGDSVTAFQDSVLADHQGLFHSDA